MAQIISDRFLPEQLKQGDVYTKKSLVLDKMLGAIITYGDENPHKNAFNFLDDNIKNLLVGFKRNNSCEEILKHELEIKGKNYKNLSFVQKRDDEGKLHYQVFYNDLLLGQVEELRNGKKARVQKQELLWKIIDDVMNDKIPYNETKEGARPLVEYKNLDKDRIKQLDEFCQKFDLNIKDLNMLNQCVLFGNYNEYKIGSFDSYERLEYVGDALLDYFSYYIFLKNNPDAKNGDFASVNNFLKNETLAQISQDIGLAGLRISTNEKFSDKRYADFFEALIAVIYFNDEENGFNNVCKFLEENFLDEILGR